MKKIRTLISTALLAIGAVAAQAIDVVINVDDASHVEVYANYQKVDPEGNTFTATVQEYSTVEVRGVNPWQVKTVTNSSGTSVGYISSGNWSIYPSSYDTDYTYNVVTCNPDDERTGSFVIIVDDPERVSIMRMGTYTAITGLVAEQPNTVKFNPQTETAITISSAIYGEPIYEVTVDGEDCDYRNGIALTEGCVINIISKIPALEATLNFTFPDEDLSEVLSVSLDGAPATIVDGKVTATTGQKLSVTWPQTYNVSSAVIDGVYYNYVISNVTITKEETEIIITGHKYGTIKVKVDYDPELVEIYNGYSNYYPAVEPDENGIVELAENNTYLAWMAKSGCMINSVTINGTAVGYGNNAQLQDGDEVVIDAEAIVMDKTAMLYFAANPADFQYLQISGNDDLHTTYDGIHQGYNEIKFYAGITQLNIGAYSPTTAISAVYVNGKAIDTTYGLNVDIADGDVIKVYTSAPTEANVNIEVDDETDAELLADHITAIAAGNHNMHHGTEIHISGANLDVTCDDQPVNINEDGIYVITVSADHNISVKTSQVDGIHAIEATNGSSAIFDLQGRQVVNPGHGLYIINGKKVIR